MFVWGHNDDKGDIIRTIYIGRKDDDEEFGGVRWNQFYPGQPISLQHPCDKNITCLSHSACWLGSKSLDNIGPQHDVFSGKSYYTYKTIKHYGWWVGGLYITDDVVLARRLIYIPAYIDMVMKVLSDNRDWYGLIDKLKQSSHTFKLCDRFNNSDIARVDCELSYSYLLCNMINGLLA